MNVEWMSEIDILKAYPRAVHDSAINSDGRLARLFEDTVCMCSLTLNLSAVCFLHV